jgi:hypothetical protein
MELCWIFPIGFSATRLGGQLLILPDGQTHRQSTTASTLLNTSPPSRRRLNCIDPQWRLRGKPQASRKSPERLSSGLDASHRHPEQSRLTLAGRYNRYLAVAARVVRRSLKEDKRIAAESRGNMELRFAKWQVRAFRQTRKGFLLWRG